MLRPFRSCTFFKERSDNIRVVFLSNNHLPVAISPSSNMWHKNPLSIFQCDHRVTTSQVSSNKPQPVTRHTRLAERFKLIGQKTSQSSAKHSGVAGSAVAHYNDEPKLLFTHLRVCEQEFFFFSKIGNSASKIKLLR